MSRHSLEALAREPRGFGFVQYLDPYDAEEAQYHMNHQILCGRELTVIFAEENRKKPYEMRNKERLRSRGFSEDNGRVYHRDRSRSYSRSRTPPRWHRYSRSPDERSHHYSPSGSRSRSLSPGRHHSGNRTNERSSGSQSRKYMERPPSGSPVNSHRYSGSRSRERSSSYGDDSSGERYSESPSS
ncbi:hypothetical protein KP509_39G002900 [Ceratopteris richardii]|uniref:RRM domain-containing protein n=1 Tax=Ceratopteris richardii TaxID=49495 RepID=A0A8T2PXU0_CERRI|nr:hypothetical protein KP509_39G002900 [Ceratopteris richardii]